MESKVLVWLESHRLGQDEPMHGVSLMQAFIENLPLMPSAPDCVILVNGGCFLATRNPRSIEVFQRLQAEFGTRVLVCEESLQHFALEKKPAIGQSMPLLQLMRLYWSAQQRIVP